MMHFKDQYISLRLLTGLEHENDDQENRMTESSALVWVQTIVLSKQAADAGVLWRP
jgi:hypothetical protein